MSAHYVARPLPPLDPEMDASRNHYWTYQGIDSLLACKKPLTASKDEDLFIAVHQVCEIAFHQMILDLDRTLAAGFAALAAGDPIGDAEEARYFLKRVLQFWRTVNTTMPVLTGLRAFAEFRTSIGPTSGFQSAQFRQIEIMSGVRAHYWKGGTADASGQVHVAETEFDKRYGADVARWFAQYRDRSLVAFCEALLARAPLPELRAHPEAGPMLGLLERYDQAQLTFHRAHLALAVIQLRKVGVEVGTGGTSFKDYLARYDQLHAPLFPALTGNFSAEESLASLHPDVSADLAIS
jgi:tryptophan 2,3-dioxygenase